MKPHHLLIALIYLSCPAANAEEATAVVAKYLPPKAEHLIVRTGGEEALVGLGTPLYAGDTVEVMSGGSLVIAFADGARQSLEGPTSFAVPDSEPLGVAAKVYSRLQVLLGRKYRQGSNLATRNSGGCVANTPPLEAPVLGTTTYLHVGHENIALAWMGGCVPYSLTLNGAGSAHIRLEELKRPQARFNANDLAAGDYTLTIADGQSREISVSLVLTSDLPNSPIASGDSRSELDAVAHAAWLANHEDGRWRLESFQQIRPWIREGGVMAGTYGDLIMWGDPRLE